MSQGEPPAGPEELGWDDPAWPEGGLGADRGQPPPADGTGGYGTGLGPDDGYAAEGYADEGYAGPGYADAGYVGAGYADGGPGLDEELVPADTDGADDAMALEEGPADSDGAEGLGGADGQDGAYNQDTGYSHDAGYGQEPWPDGTGMGPRRRRLGRGRLHRALTVLVVLLVVVVIVAVVGLVRVDDDVHPSGPLGRVVTVKIPNGSSTVSIAHLLAHAGVVHGADVFEIYLKLESTGPLLPGTYRLATNEPYGRALAQLQAGPPVYVQKLVVPEGFTLAQMGAAVADLKGVGITRQAFLTAARSGQVRSPYEPAGTNNLEGLVFPATYSLTQGWTADQLVEYMVQTFDSRAEAAGLTAAAAKLHYTPYQVVIVASIVEREAKLEADRGPIASAIYNRLAAGMPIGAQSTLLYGLGFPKGPVNLLTPNPYNTQLHQGLPPTPIASPGLPSLLAAMHPPKTTYLYWVEVNPDGKMGFASNNAGFKHLQKECRAAGLGC